MNWRVWVMVGGIIAIWVLSHYGNMDNTYVREETDVFMKPVVVQPEPTIEDKIKEYFPRSWRTMIAVAHAESHMNNEAMGYNCYYKGSTVYTHRVKGAVSKACAVNDRSKAWSVDCFVLQRNYPNRKTCPEGVTLDMHLREVAELSKKQGLQAWSSYNAGTHKAYLTKN